MIDINKILGGTFNENINDKPSTNENKKEIEPTPSSIQSNNKTYNIIGQFNDDEPIFLFGNIDIDDTFFLKFDENAYIEFFDGKNKTFKIYSHINK